MVINKSNLQEVMDHIKQLVQEGIEKEFFEFKVSFSAQSKDKMRVHIVGGASKQFLLRTDETHK